MPAQDFGPQIEAYILGFPEPVQQLLREVRRVVTLAAPDAQEVISYRMPALRQKGMLVYYAAFKHHIGLYPPVRGDAALVQAAAPYAGEKGNLRFPYDQPLPLELIERIVRYRVRLESEMNRAKSRP